MIIIFMKIYGILFNIFQEDDMIVGFVNCAGETDCILVVNLFVNSPLFTFGLCYPYCYFLLYQT